MVHNFHSLAFHHSSLFFGTICIVWSWSPGFSSTWRRICSNFVLLPVRIEINFSFNLLSSTPSLTSHSPWVADVSDSGYVANEAKENPRGAESEPPIAEAVDFPSACTMS